MDKKTSKFAVGSKGYCFLCLNKILTIIPDGIRNISNPAVYSLKDVARYLEVDMRKAFIAGGPIPPQLLAKVKKSRLTVELCEDCGSMTENISKLCQQLEKLKLEIESGLESIHGKMAEADNTNRADQFRRVMGSELVSGMGGGMEIMEALRLETMYKCSSKIKVASPRLPIQKLSSKEIRRRTHRIPKKSLEPEQMSDSVLQENKKITIEDPDTVNWGLKDDLHSDNSVADDFHDAMDDSMSAIVKNEGEAIPMRLTNDDDNNGEGETSFNDDFDCNNPDDPISSLEQEGATVLGRMTGPSNRRPINPNRGIGAGNNSKQKVVINPVTGKYKCVLCQMEYASKTGFDFHYSTVHRKIRFKCKICGKEFTRECSYKVHHQSAHMGIRFQCKVCKKSFSTKGHMLTHQRKAGCALNAEESVN